MKQVITFTATVGSLIDAAALEEHLKGAKIPHSFVVEEVTETQKQRINGRRVHHTVTTEIIDQIRRYNKKHPAHNNATLKAKLKLPHSLTTISRVITGDHVLLKSSGKGKQGRLV